MDTIHKAVISSIYCLIDESFTNVWPAQPQILTKVSQNADFPYKHMLSI